jgi:predicted protein tyrosine phosphatase
MGPDINFIVVSRREIRRGLPLHAPYIIISISDPEKPTPKIRRSGLCRGILRLQFHDAEPTSRFILPPEIKIMSRRQALTIWRFVYRHLGNIKIIVVHCEEGMSRSPAVAAGICKGLGGDDSRFFREYQPNDYIYRLVLDSMPSNP